MWSGFAVTIFNHCLHVRPVFISMSKLTFWLAVSWKAWEVNGCECLNATMPVEV